MASEEWIQFAVYYLVIPFFVWIGIIITLAAIGKSCGVRALYIKILVLIFEWGKKMAIEHHQNKALGMNGEVIEQEEDDDVLQDDEDVKLFNLRHSSVLEEEEAEQESSLTLDPEWGKKQIKVHEQQQEEGEEEEDDVVNDEEREPVKDDDLSSPGKGIQPYLEDGEQEEAAGGDVLEPIAPTANRKRLARMAAIKDNTGEEVEDGSQEEVLKETLPNGDTVQVIAREFQLSPQGPWLARHYSIAENKYREFQLGDIMYFAKSGIEAIIEDEVTKRFSAEELNSWNLLTRTNTKHEFISLRLTAFWFIGWVLRYIILLPFRACLALYAIGLMILGTALIGYMPDGKRKRWCYDHLSLMCYRVMGRAFSAVVTFHNKENRAKGGGICVANHTSPIDIIILGGDNTYAMVGQAQGGFFGIMQRAMSRAEHHVWFHREESRDRLAVARRLKEHVEDKTKLPILIFPEGTCINNTSIMMFKKGSFEVGGTIYPVAIKYDPKFADAFWNSSQQSFVKHLLLIITSWAIVCDVWYLPPQNQRKDEDAIQFANRVKAEIAMQGGLVDLDWDGGLKRSQPKSSMKQKQQEEYSKRLKGE